MPLRSSVGSKVPSVAFVTGVVDVLIVVNAVSPASRYSSFHSVKVSLLAVPMMSVRLVMTAPSVSPENAEDGGAPDGVGVGDWVGAAVAVAVAVAVTVA